MPNSTRKNAVRASGAGGPAAKPHKPLKDYPDFPLYPHPLGYWSKKVNGKIQHFGRWARVVSGVLTAVDYEQGWKDAIAKYHAQSGNVKAGRVRESVVPDAPAASATLTVADLCNQFLTSKLARIASGELTQRSFQELKSTTDRIVAAFGKARSVGDLRPNDFQNLRGDIAKTCGPVRLGNEIVRVRSVFKYAAVNQLIDRPVIFGSEFEKPKKAVLLKEKHKRGKKLFTVAELRLLLDALDGKEVQGVMADAKKFTLTANPAFRAAVLLGVNAGAGNTDVANLVFDHLDLDAGWLHYPRNKTGIDRRVPLWPETVAALKAAVATRSIPVDKRADGKVVLLTRQGERLVRVYEKSRTDAVARTFGKLLKSLGINGRKGLNFYSLRHTFATIGLETGDRDAVKSLMGHAYGDMLALYDEAGPSDQRLKAVTDHVRAWLFGGEGGAA